MNAFMRPDLDHGYSTTNQPLLNNRSVQYTRGKALGGSSVLNFMGTWTRDADSDAYVTNDA
jgi:choline dehydrogenase-like flavoprotein